MSSQPKTRDVVVTRVFNAPVERVWRAWSDADQIRRWWGPTGFTCPVCNHDFREGGESLVSMRSPDGQDFYNLWAFQKIVPQQEIELVMSFCDANGQRIDPTSLGLPPEMARAVPQRITFKPLDDGRTEMTMIEYGYTSDQVHDLSKAGLEQCLDKMDAAFG